MAGMNDVYGKPGHLIRRAQQIAVAIFMEECAAFDLTPVQYATLVAVRDNPDADATRLSALVAYDRSTLGLVIARLEKKGFLARKPGKDDKRTKRLILTRSGDTLLRRAEPVVQRSQERILAPLDTKAREQLMALLGQLVELNNESSRVPLRLVAAQ